MYSLVMHQIGCPKTPVEKKASGHQTGLGYYSVCLDKPKIWGSRCQHLPHIFLKLLFNTDVQLHFMSEQDTGLYTHPS